MDVIIKKYKKGLEKNIKLNHSLTSLEISFKVNSRNANKFKSLFIKYSTTFNRYVSIANILLDNYSKIQLGKEFNVVYEKEHIELIYSKTQAYDYLLDQQSKLLKKFTNECDEISEIANSLFRNTNIFNVEEINYDNVDDSIELLQRKVNTGKILLKLNPIFINHPEYFLLKEDLIKELNKILKKKDYNSSLNNSNYISNLDSVLCEVKGCIQEMRVTLNEIDKDYFQSSNISLYKNTLVYLSSSYLEGMSLNSTHNELKKIKSHNIEILNILVNYKAKLEQERLAKIEQKRLAKLEQKRLAKLEKERLAKIEQERLAKLEQERLAKLEQERLAKLEQERLAKLEQERLAKLEQERLAKLEQERLAKLEQERLAKLEQERLAKIEQERLAKLEQERLAKLEQERLATLERERLAKLEQERLAKLEQERRSKQINAFRIAIRKYVKRLIYSVPLLIILLSLTYQNELLIFSVDNGNVSLTRLLLFMNANPNSEVKSNSIIYLKDSRLYRYNTSLLGYVLNHKLGLEKKVYINLVKLLLDYGANVNNTKNQYGDNYFKLCINKNNWSNLYCSETAGILLNYSANPDVIISKEDSLISPLVGAIEEGNYEFAALLINNGADIMGKNLLHKIIRVNKVGRLNDSLTIKLISILKSKGIKLDEVDKEGKTVNERITENKSSLLLSLFIEVDTNIKEALPIKVNNSIKNETRPKPKPSKKPRYPNAQEFFNTY